MGAPGGDPAASRRSSIAGNATGAPAELAARAGAGPAQATVMVSSPERKRWQRTPFVPRPFAG
jgi:hypothetical protein